MPLLDIGLVSFAILAVKGIGERPVLCLAATTVVVRVEGGALLVVPALALAATPQRRDFGQGQTAHPVLQRTTAQTARHAALVAFMVYAMKGLDAFAKQNGLDLDATCAQAHSSSIPLASVLKPKALPSVMCLSCVTDMVNALTQTIPNVQTALAVQLGRGAVIVTLPIVA